MHKAPKLLANFLLYLLSTQKVNKKALHLNKFKTENHMSLHPSNSHWHTEFSGHLNIHTA